MELKTTIFTMAHINVASKLHTEKLFQKIFYLLRSIYFLRS